MPSHAYLEPIRQTPLRFALGNGLLDYLGMLFVTACYDTLGLTLLEAWLATLAVPVVSGVDAYRRARWRQPGAALRPHPPRST